MLALVIGACFGTPAVAGPAHHHHAGHHGPDHTGVLPVTASCCAVAALPARPSVPVAVAAVPVVWPFAPEAAPEGRSPSPEPPPPRPAL